MLAAKYSYAEKTLIAHMSESLCQVIENIEQELVVMNCKKLCLW